MSDRRQRFPWIKAPTSFLEAQASNGMLPLWVRVSLAAWAHIDHRGVATFGALGLDGLTASSWSSGDGALQVDNETGELAPPAKLPRALSEASSRGWIGPGGTLSRVTVPHTVLSVGRIQNAPWRRLQQSHLEAAYSDHKVPGWLRASLAAYAYMGPSGVASFASGELADIAQLSNLRRELQLAIAAGWVGAGSTGRRVLWPEGVAVGLAA